MKAMLFALALCASTAVSAAVIPFDFSGVGNNTVVGTLNPNFSVTGGTNFISVDAAPPGTGFFTLVPNGEDNAVLNSASATIVIDLVGFTANTFDGYIASVFGGTVTIEDVGGLGILDTKPFIATPVDGLGRQTFSFFSIQSPALTPFSRLTVTALDNSVGIGNIAHFLIPVPVPEPSTYALLGLLLLSVGGVAIRNRRASRATTKDGPSSEGDRLFQYFNKLLYFLYVKRIQKIYPSR